MKQNLFSILVILSMNLLLISCASLSSKEKSEISSNKNFDRSISSEKENGDDVKKPKKNIGRKLLGIGGQRL